MQIFPGRFQPFHKEHEDTIENIKRKTGEYPIIGIYQSKERTLNNPFTYEEREEMILYKFPDIEIFPFSLQLSKNKKILGIDERIELYTGNLSRYIGSVFFGYRPRYIKSPKEITGEYLRDLIYSENEEWKKYVNRKTAEIVEELEEDGIFEELLSHRKEKFVPKGIAKILL